MRGELDTKAEMGVIDELASELIDGTGIGMKLRDQEVDDAPPMLLAAD